jgi:hypothetical protein
LIDAHILPAFGKDMPAAITRNRVEVWHGRIAEATPIHANRALGVLSSWVLRFLSRIFETLFETAFRATVASLIKWRRFDEPEI